MARRRRPDDEWAFVLFNVAGAQVWHQRLLIGQVKGSSATEVDLVVATPEGDVHEDCYDTDSVDISAVRFSSQMWPPPPGLPRARCYRFRARPDAAALVELKRQAEEVSRTVWARVQRAAGRPGAPVPDKCLEAIGVGGAG